MSLICRSVFRTSHKYTGYCKFFRSFSSPVLCCNKNSNWIIIPRKLNFSLCKHFLRNETNMSNMNETDDKESKAYEELVSRVFHVSEMGHQVLVIQPYVKWGPNKKQNTTPDHQLAEAVALVGTLRKWKVVDKMKISLNSLEKNSFFGTGNLEMLRNKIQMNKQITAVFLSTNMLRGRQHRELEEKFGVPVYDRYMVVIQIFREHAVSKEAKLQVALAEIPYLRMKIKGLHEGIVDHQGAGVAAIGGAGETYIEARKRILALREMKINRMVERLRNHRMLLRSKRKKLEYPVVSVIGYTNAGKTSLIKALTGEKSLVPKDYLFATLDVTAHAGVLPSKLEVLYIDTVGFISDIPTQLIESFMATLEDALNADIIIHVCDVSHPDFVAQVETVNKMLESLNLSSDLLNNIIVVGNKVDLLPDTVREKNDCSVLVSAVTNQGLRELEAKIEKHILEATGRVSVTIRVPVDGEELKWLYKCAVVTHVSADSESSQHLLLKVIITEGQLNKFKHNFIQNIG